MSPANAPLAANSPPPAPDPLLLSSTEASCGSARSREAISAATASELAHTLKALADPTRLRLISMVAAHTDAEACVCDLTEPLGLSQGTVSHHLKVLVDAGIFRRSKRGTWAFYRLVPDALGSLTDRVVNL